MQKDYAKMICLTEHLRAMLEQRDYLQAIVNEVVIISKILREIRQTRSKVAEDAEWPELINKPKNEWDEYETSYIAFRNRLIIVDDLKEAFEKEAVLVRKMTISTLRLVPSTLRKRLLEVVECEEEQAHLDGLDPAYFKREVPKGRFLGPVKLPPPIQAMYKLEMELFGLMEQEPKNSLLYRIAKNQYHAVWKLQRYLVADLFEAKEDVLGAGASLRLEIVNDWHMRVVFD